MTAKGSYWENGGWVETEPMEIKRAYDFAQIGKRDMYLLHHEELESLGKNIRGIQRIRFFMTFGQSYLTHLRCLQNVGMTSIKPIMFEGKPIIPLQFLKAVLPDPASLGPRTKGKTNIGCIFQGIKDGQPKTYYLYNVCDHQECYREVGSQAISYTTGVPAMALAIKLAQAGVELIGIDSDECKVKELRAYTEHAFVVSDLGIETLRETGIQNCDTVVICIGEKIDASILTTLHVVQLGVKNVISKATTDDQGSLLAILGAQVVFPERDMAERLAAKLVSTNVMDYISISNEVDISEVRVGEHMHGQTIRSIDFRKHFNLNVIALVRGGDTIIEIDPDDVLRSDDILAVIGKKENISRFEEFLAG